VDPQPEGGCPRQAVLPLLRAGATHSPHHPKPEWIAGYNGRFDAGWDKVREETLARQKQLGIAPPATELTERSRGIPAWDSYNAEQRELFAYMMQVYAGYLSQADYNAGRVLDAIDRMGLLDNTLVIYIVGDNGASGEGCSRARSTKWP